MRKNKNNIRIGGVMNKEIMKSVGLEEFLKRIESGSCPTCDKLIVIKNFRDLSSLREFEISGMCQECQDKTFGITSSEPDEQFEEDMMEAELDEKIKAEELEEQEREREESGYYEELERERELEDEQR